MFGQRQQDCKSRQFERVCLDQIIVTMFFIVALIRQAIHRLLSY